MSFTGQVISRRNQLSSALSFAFDFKSHFCKQSGPWSDCSSLITQSDHSPHCLPVCKNRFEKFARIFSRWHKQTTFSGAGFPGILRVNWLCCEKILNWAKVHLQGIFGQLIITWSSVSSEKVCTVKSLIRLHRFTYRIYPKFSDSSTTYHTCSKFWTSTIYYPLSCLKIARCVAKSVEPDEMPYSVASHQGLHCLHRPVCPDKVNKVCSGYCRLWLSTYALNSFSP